MSADTSFIMPGPIITSAMKFGTKVAYTDTSAPIAPDLNADFKVSEILNLGDMEKTYGFTLNVKEKELLEKNKFVMLPLTETSIKPKMGNERYREFLGLYKAVNGDYDYKARTQASSIFLSADIFFHSYNLLYTELLKEMENTIFAPAMRNLSERFYKEADKKFTAASDNEKETWRKVRNYFAVPYALLATSKQPLDADDYMGQVPEELQRTFGEDDKKADTIETATAFINALKLDETSNKEVLGDLQFVYKADGPYVPTVFKPEYEQYAKDMDITFTVDFTQFTPRSHYTGSSLRRQYFRSMMWMSQLPFFVKNAELTKYAFAATQLTAENPQQLSDYAKLESTINFLVGESDDLMPSDYMQSLEAAKGKPDQESAIMEFLAKARPPKIKNLHAEYSTVGEKETADVLLATKGMRFFSGKFIIDSYWTGQLTQGDEAPKPGYTQKLPPMASSLEVMALLGSDYAKSKIPTLDFYKPETKQAIDKAMADLQKETDALDQAFWTGNVYNGWLWTIKSLFSWQQTNHDKLPRFMQSELWGAKTLMTGAGFWTELRHATLLYAKQSFAELGGGAPCDSRIIPPPARGYIEPQVQAFDRLSYLAKKTQAGLQEIGFDNLRNMSSLESFVSALDMTQSYVVKELGNQKLADEIIETTKNTTPEGEDCTEYWLKDGVSEWEDVRVDIIGALESSLPWPVEGPVLPAKDKRAALIADVHTGGDSLNPTRILYEGTGVPNVILVAVKDVNGPRLTIGFTYAQFEFTEPYGGKRLTDEDWQKKFYVGDDEQNAFEYTPRALWPVVPSWFAPLFSR